MSLSGWEITKRLSFVIKSSVVEEDIGELPFLFKLSTDTGTTDVNTTKIFSALTYDGDSTLNRHKIAVTQLISGEEVQCFCEIGSWDHTNLHGSIWIKPKELSSTVDNMFYLYYDKNHEDNYMYVSTTDSSSVTLFMDIGVEGSYDTAGAIPFDILKIDNTYKMWYLGYNSKWSIMYCESTDMTTWSGHQRVIDNTHTYDAASHFSGTVLYDDGIYKMWYSGRDSLSWRLMYCDSVDGIVWDNYQLVVDLSQSPYSDKDAISCAVVKEGSIYKMWYGGYKTTPANGRIIYCESDNGINWTNHQMVLDYTDTPIQNATYVRPCRVTYVDGLYRMWLNVYDGSTWLLFYSTSNNGVDWATVTSFASLDLESTYDTDGNKCLAVLEEDGYYNFFYSGLDGVNWRILKHKSISLAGPRTPAQEVWSDDFFSVHHLNNEYGYVDSTDNNLNILSTTDVSPTTYLGIPALNYTSDGSNVQIPNSNIFDSTDYFGITIFSNIHSGTVLYYKGNKVIYYSTSEKQLILDDTFTGTDGDAPNELLWDVVNVTSSGNSFNLQNNKLRFSGDNADTVEVTSIYSLACNFDIQVDWSEDSGTNVDRLNIIFRVSSTDGSKYVDIRYHRYSTNAQWATYTEAGYYNFSSRSMSNSSFRIIRTGDSYKLYTHTVNWDLRATIDNTLGDNVKVSLLVAVESGYPDVNVDFDNFKVNEGIAIWPDPETEVYTAIGKLTDTETTHALSVTASGTTSTDVLIHFGKEAVVGADTVFYLNDKTIASDTSSLVNSSNNVYIGNNCLSVNGVVIEILFSDSALSQAKQRYLKASFTDSLITLSSHYIQGYTTLYEEPITTTVLAYDALTGALVGVTQSSPTDGYYYMQLSSGNECFLIGVDGGLYNHYVLGKVIPTYFIS